MNTKCTYRFISITQTSIKVTPQITETQKQTNRYCSKDSHIQFHHLVKGFKIRYSLDVSWPFLHSIEDISTCRISGIYLLSNLNTQAIRLCIYLPNDPFSWLLSYIATASYVQSRLFLHFLTKYPPLVPPPKPIRPNAKHLNISVHSL